MWVVNPDHLEFGNVGFSGRRKTGVPGEKPSEQGENQQQTQLTYDTGPESNRATLVEGEHSHHCAIPAPQFIYTKPLVQLVSQSVRYMVKSFTYLNIWSVFLSHLYRRIRVNVTNLDSSKSFFKKKQHKRQF